MGRVMTAPEARGRGHGRALMQEGLAGAARRFPGRDLRIAAQQRLEAFYASLGFVAALQPYLRTAFRTSTWCAAPGPVCRSPSNRARTAARS